MRLFGFRQLINWDNGAPVSAIIHNEHICVSVRPTSLPRKELDSDLGTMTTGPIKRLIFVSSLIPFPLRFVSFLKKEKTRGRIVEKAQGCLRNIRENRISATSRILNDLLNYAAREINDLLDSRMHQTNHAERKNIKTDK